MNAAAGSIVLLHGVVPADAPPDEQDVLTQVEEIAGVLQERGYSTFRLPLTLDLASARRQLLQWRPRIIFNLVESLDGIGRFSHVGALLAETLSIPYTGCSSAGLFVTANKCLAKQWLQARGLPTPAWIEARDPAPPVAPGPWIVKSVWEEASYALDDNALARAPAELARLLADRRARFGGDWFAETYIEGREFNLSLLADGGALTVLPPAETCFIDFPPDKPKLVGYAAKWDSASFEYRHTPRRFNFPAEDRPLLQRLMQLAAQCGDAFQLEGYARVDFRVDAAGHPWVLEINANPCLAADAGLMAAARQAGLSVEDVIERIVTAALAKA